MRNNKLWDSVQETADQVVQLAIQTIQYWQRGNSAGTTDWKVQQQNECPCVGTGCCIRHSKEAEAWGYSGSQIFALTSSLELKHVIF